MCIILSNSKRGQTSMLISYTMKEALYISKNSQYITCSIKQLVFGISSVSFISKIVSLIYNKNVFDHQSRAFGILQ